VIREGCRFRCSNAGTRWYYNAAEGRRRGRGKQHTRKEKKVKNISVEQLWKRGYDARIVMAMIMKSIENTCCSQQKKESENKSKQTCIQEREEKGRDWH
jgi:hypothetical protein